MGEALCYYTVMRYVADPQKGEGRNIGVLLIAPELGLATARFNTARSGLPSGSRRLSALQEIAKQYRIDMPPSRQLDMFRPLPGSWKKNDLLDLHRECTNLIQFSLPGTAIGDPQHLLDSLYRRMLMSRPGGSKKLTTAAAAQRFQTAFARRGIESWVQRAASVEVRGKRYDFDLGVKNGRLYYAVETLSFTGADLLLVEKTGGWYARVWEDIGDQVDAHALLFVERPAVESAEARQRRERVEEWANNASIRSEDAAEMGKVAEEIASELAPVSD